MAEVDFLILDGQLAEFLQHAISETLKESFRIRAHPETWSVGRQMPLELDSLEICKIDLKQEDVLCGAFIAAFSRDILIKILSQCNPNGLSDQEMIDDAAAEVANMIFGLFKTAINKTGYRLTMNIPSTPRRKRDIVKKYEQVEKMVQPFMVDGHQCQIIIAQNR